MSKPTLSYEALHKPKGAAGKSVASKWGWLSTLAFSTTIALVGARMLMPEAIRNATDPLASGATSLGALGTAPLSPGPATGLIFDWLFCIPALLILLRRCVDPAYSLRFLYCFVPAGLLGLLAVASAMWATDRFACIVSASHLLCAMVVIWSTAQLVREWSQVKLIGGLCLGLLICLAISGYEYRLSELQNLRAMWEEHQLEILKQNRFKPGSVEAEMLKNRILKGQPMGYSASTNTYAALLVLMGTIAAGAIIQHIANRDHLSWSIVPGAALLATPALLYFTQCRAAYATPVFGIGLFAMTWIFGRRLARWSRGLYVAAVVTILVGAYAMIRHGLEHNTLWHDSLTFRWRYWLGAWNILHDPFVSLAPDRFRRWFVGVGWENFGPYYLTHRLPVAAEEIRDPHNFFVRVCVELGIVGGILLISWLLLLGWRLTVTQAAATEIDNPAQHNRPLLSLALLSFAILVSSIVAAVDFHIESYAIFEILRRLLFAVAIFVGFAVVSLQASGSLKAHISFQRDDRPAPWLVAGIVIALGTFLIHNLIEFSLFEPGPLGLFAVLCGTALGIRTAGLQPAVAARENKRKDLAPRIALSTVAIAWTVAAIVVVGPVVIAENSAASADADVITFLQSHDRSNIEQARDEMHLAHRLVPNNADYARREAEMAIAHGDSPADVIQLFDQAAAADPRGGKSFVMRAQYLLTHDQPDRAIDDYAWALQLDPINVRMRLEFAAVLHRLSATLHRPQLASQALLEYDRALDYNNQLPPDELKRLTAEEADEARRSLQ